MKHRDIIEKMTLEEKALLLSGKMNGRRGIWTNIISRHFSAQMDLTVYVNRQAKEITWD